MSKKVWIYGVIYGLVSMISTYAMFNNIGGMWTNVALGYLFFIVMSVFYVKGLRKETGFSPFKNIVRDLFVITVVSIIISFILSQIYISTLSDDAKILMQEKFVQGQIDTYSSFGFPEETMEGMEDELIKNADQMFSVKNTLMGLPFALGFMAIMCIIIGLIMKRDPEIGSDELVADH